MNLTKTQWPLGWTPDADPVNGNPSGLIRMDNLQQEEDGSLSIVRGISQIQTGLPGYVAQIYSKIIGSTEFVYLALAGGSVQRGGLSGDFGEICSGNQTASFGDCLGQVLIMSGSTRKKDQGGSSLKDLGLITPSMPQITVNSQQFLEMKGGITASEGMVASSTTTGAYVAVDQVSVRANVTLGYGGDTTSIGTGGANTGNSDNDIFEFQFTPDDSSVVTSVEIRFNFDNGAYYRNVWLNSDLTQGLAQTSTLSCLRKDFQYNNSIGTTSRHGAGSVSGGWNTISSVQVIVVQTSYTSFNIDHFRWTGGARGLLNGNYMWAQVNKGNNGVYVAVSPMSQPTGVYNIYNGYVTINPGSTDSQVTDIYIYRISVNGGLNNWYQVAHTTPGAAVDDTISDVEALEINAIANPFLLTVKSGDPNGLPDDIFGIEGMWNTRMLYMAINYLYISDTLNPDAVDSRYTIKAFGDPTERNLWISRLSNNVYILATNKNNYEISGTLQPLPDGTLDVTVVPIGEKYPSLTMDHCLIPGGGIVYMGGDGPRQMLGSNSVLLSNNMRLLFQNESRSGIPAAVLYPGDHHYGLAAGKTRLYVSTPTTDGGYRLFIYDFVKNVWRMQYTDPTAIWATVTDHILLGYNTPNAIFELDVGTGITQGGVVTQGIPFTFLTVCDHNGQPRNRKDTFTLKVIADTGGSPVDVYVGIDGGALAFLGTVNCNGLATSYFPMNGFTLGFRYQIKMVDQALVTVFHLDEVTIEYDPRPEQLDYLRIQPENLGTISRKRIVNYAFVIDTLGHSIIFTPYIDNSNAGILPAQSTVNTNAKQTYIHYFHQEQIGTDINGILSGGVFEFYRVATEEIISEKMPVPVEYLVIPPNNFGTPDRKRHSSYKFQINTRGNDVKFIPIIDGISFASVTYNTSVKTTVEYFFTSDTIGIDIGGTLDSNGSGPFEFYGIVVPQQIEVLPPRLEFFLIPPNDYGKPNRKRHTSYKFQLNTNGHNCTFTPIVDGTSYTPTIFNTPSKQTVEHFFTQTEGDVIGIDIGGTLSSNSPFEFYGIVVPQEVEVLPSRLEYFRIPNTNYGVAARKRVRTIPIVIDTYGRSVIFTPIVDGFPGVPATLISRGKTTLYYFFSSDSFGIDYGGVLQCGDGPFEFYELGQPEDVETLPVPKKYDQIGPFNFDKIGKIFDFRVRMIMIGTTTIVPFAIYGDNIVSDPTYGVPLYVGQFTVIPGVDNTYQIQLPKNVNTNIFRLVLGPTADYFHRYDVMIRVSLSGMASDAQWRSARMG